MELEIVEENGAGRLDASAVEENLRKYSLEKDGLESALERTRFELGNARRIFETIKRLSLCGSRPHDGFGVTYFFFTESGHPAVPFGLVPKEHLPDWGRTLAANMGSRDLFTPWGLRIVPFAKVKKVQCPGCPQMRILAGSHSSGGYYTEFVICGNSLHVINEECGKQLLPV